MNELERKGLTSEQVAESRRLHGDNVITPRKGDSAWKLLLDKFRGSDYPGAPHRRAALTGHGLL